MTEDLFDLFVHLLINNQCLVVCILIISIDQGELVIRDLGNSFINHQWTQLWNQVSTRSPDVFKGDSPERRMETASPVCVCVCVCACVCV